MQVRHDEGVAIRIDPEPCAAVRKGDSKASAGECIGRPLSLAKIRILGADAIAKAKATWTDASAQASGQPGVVEEPGMCRSFLGGNQGDPTSDQSQQSGCVRIGKARSLMPHGRGKSDYAVVCAG